MACYLKSIVYFVALFGVLQASNDTANSTLSCDTCQAFTYSGDGADLLTAVLASLDEPAATCETTELTACPADEEFMVCRTMVLGLGAKGVIEGIGAVDLTIEMTQKGCMSSFMTCALYETAMAQQGSGMFGEEVETEFLSCKLEEPSSGRGVSMYAVGVLLTSLLIMQLL